MELGSRYKINNKNKNRAKILTNKKRIAYTLKIGINKSIILKNLWKIYIWSVEMVIYTNQLLIKIINIKMIEIKDILNQNIQMNH